MSRNEKTPDKTARRYINSPEKKSATNEKLIPTKDSRVNSSWSQFIKRGVPCCPPRAARPPLEHRHVPGCECFSPFSSYLRIVDNGQGNDERASVRAWNTHGHCWPYLPEPDAAQVIVIPSRKHYSNCHIDRSAFFPTPREETWQKTTICQPRQWSSQPLVVGDAIRLHAHKRPLENW